jgi:hypothetical protein
VSDAYGVLIPPEAKDQRIDIVLKRIRRLVREEASGAPVAVEFF